MRASSELIILQTICGYIYSTQSNSTFLLIFLLLEIIEKVVCI